jgi:hypothetical protein
MMVSLSVLYGRRCRLSVHGEAAQRCVASLSTGSRSANFKTSKCFRIAQSAEIELLPSQFKPIRAGNAENAVSADNAVNDDMQNRQDTARRSRNQKTGNLTARTQRPRRRNSLD